MIRELLITDQPLDEIAFFRKRTRSCDSGAVVTFFGVVRGSEGGTAIRGLDYEAFHAMAVRQFHLIFDEVERRWPIDAIRLVHRTGRVEAGNPSLLVEIMAGHRKEALQSMDWLIDEMKRTVPIWKTPWLAESA